MHHPHREAEVVAVEQRLQVAVGQADLLRRGSRSARKSACSAPSSRGALQRGVGELAQRQRGELGVDRVASPACHRLAAPASARTVRLATAARC